MLVTAFKLINMVFFLLVLRFCVNNWWKRAKTLKITIIGNISHENMFATFLLTSILITLTNGESRLTTSNYKAVNFAKEIRGRRLNGSVTKEIEVDSESSCRLQCVEETSCLSYNFGPGEDKKMFKCQLSNSDRFTGLNNFIEDPQVLYRGIKVGNLSQFAIFFHSKEDIIFYWRNDVDVYIGCLVMVMVKKYNLRITVENFSSSSDFERRRFKL